MYKIKKKTPSQKPPVLYNIIEDYSEYDPPGNVTVCATTEPEQFQQHARVLSESYGIPLDTMQRLLRDGGVYVYPQTGALVTRGLFACKVDPTGECPKQTWVLDLVQYAEAEQMVRSHGMNLADAAERVFYRTLPPDLQARLKNKNLRSDDHRQGLTTEGGRITYIDFRKDWSPHFKRLCIFPDGRLVETGGIEEFASLHGITVDQATALIQDGGTLEVDGDVLACQIVNGQPAVARFHRGHYAKAKELVAAKGLHLIDALSEVGLHDPVMMQALRRLEQRIEAERAPGRR
jgi:hypothetical protein